jgi:hypothetical protein
MPQTHAIPNAAVAMLTKTASQPCPLEALTTRAEPEPPDPGVIRRRSLRRWREGAGREPDAQNAREQPSHRHATSIATLRIARPLKSRACRMRHVARDRSGEPNR